LAVYRCTFQGIAIKAFGTNFTIVTIRIVLTLTFSGFVVTNGGISGMAVTITFNAAGKWTAIIFVMMSIYANLAELPPITDGACATFHPIGLFPSSSSDHTVSPSGSVEFYVIKESTFLADVIASDPNSGYVGEQRHEFKRIELGGPTKFWILM